MIKVIFSLTESNYTLNIDLKLPTLPNIGHQFFLTDFMDESEIEQLEKTEENINLDAMFVESICWMYDKKESEPYVQIWLTNK